LLNANRLRRLLVTMAAIFACLDAFAQAAKSEMSEARRNVFAFETKLRSLKDEKAKIKLAREFFAGLCDRETKLEALYAIDSRYVFVVPTSIEAELLSPLLADSDVKVRAEAARAVGYISAIHRTKIGVNAKPLLALIHDSDWQVRSNVLYAMGHSGDHAFLPVLKASLNDPNANVRQAAHYELGVSLAIQQEQLRKLEHEIPAKP
jgi:hypothetical protein